MTKIEWAEETWNIVTGCTKVSDGCRYCYAERMTKRLQAMGLKKYKYGFNKVVCHENELNTPLKWKKPKLIFVNSMSDLFHEEVSHNFIAQVFSTIEKSKQHIFLILTKRIDKLITHFIEMDFYRSHGINFEGLPRNVMIGVTVENNRALHRLKALVYTVYNIFKFNIFVSFEPLLEKMNASLYSKLQYVSWVIVGGETGGKCARPMKKDWVINIKNYCESLKIPFFFKQWGRKGECSDGSFKGGNLIDGKVYQEFPDFFKFHFNQNKLFK